MPLRYVARKDKSSETNSTVKVRGHRLSRVLSRGAPELGGSNSSPESRHFSSRFSSRSRRVDRRFRKQCLSKIRRSLSYIYTPTPLVAPSGVRVHHRLSLREACEAFGPAGEVAKAPDSSRFESIYPSSNRSRPTGTGASEEAPSLYGGLWYPNKSSAIS